MLGWRKAQTTLKYEPRNPALKSRRTSSIKIWVVRLAWTALWEAKKLLTGTLTLGTYLLDFFARQVKAVIFHRQFSFHSQAAVSGRFYLASGDALRSPAAVLCRETENACNDRSMPCLPCQSRPHGDLSVLGQIKTAPAVPSKCVAATRPWVRPDAPSWLFPFLSGKGCPAKPRTAFARSVVVPGTVPWLPPRCP